jgi:hypothetical protein
MDNAQRKDIQRAAKQAAQNHCGEGGASMINEVPRFVTRARASRVLGIPEEELERISRECGLGRVERAGDEEETYFTYEELQRLWVLAAYQKQMSTLNAEMCGQS